MIRNMFATVCLALLCGACGETAPKQALTVDHTATIEVEVRMEVNNKVEDSQRTSFTLAKGTPLPCDLTLTSDRNVTVTFTNLRLKNGTAEFDAWSFDGFPGLSSKSGTTLSGWPYRSQVGGGFSIPLDGSKPFEAVLVGAKNTDGALIADYVTLNVKTNSDARRLGTRDRL
jgi:hypothetical protein